MGLHPYAVDFLALSIKVCSDTGAQSGRWQVAVGSGSGRRKSRQEQARAKRQNGRRGGRSFPKGPETASKQAGKRERSGNYYVVARTRAGPGQQ